MQSVFYNIPPLPNTEMIRHVLVIGLEKNAYFLKVFNGAGFYSSRQTQCSKLIKAFVNLYSLSETEGSEELSTTVIYTSGYSFQSTWLNIHAYPYNIILNQIQSFSFKDV
jgi:hypothetical protein